MFRWLFMVLVLLMSAAVVAGQDDEPACTQDNMRNLLELVTGQIEAMREAAEVDDLETYLVNATLLRAALANIDSVCRGLTFSSETDGMMPVIGPVMFAQDGVYKAVLETDGFYIAKLTAVSGECELSRPGTSLFNHAARDGVSGAEATVRASSCIALIEISNVTQPWRLQFEMLVPSGN